MDRCYHDYRITLCAQANDGEEVSEQLVAAIQEELAALVGCAKVLGEAAETLGGG